ncbi:MAG TPA: hypothetical protein VFQ44_04135 [Streptosporangiaceae bacterium]|nr:hypothetical protein [Streptosporangiaceae bacterium]
MGWQTARHAIGQANDLADQSATEEDTDSLDSTTDALRRRATVAVEDLQSAQTISGYLEANYVAACAYALVRTDAVDQFKIPAAPSMTADAADVDAEILVRMFRFMEGHGFFSRQDDGRYELTSLDRLLCRDSPFSQRMRFADGWDGAGNLSHTLRTGESAFTHALGKDFLTWLAEHPR